MKTQMGISLEDNALAKADRLAADKFSANRSAAIAHMILAYEDEPTDITILFDEVFNQLADIKDALKAAPVA